MARRSGLGRGLGSLIPAEAVGDRSSALRDVPLSSINPNPLQPRTHFEEEALSALAASIRELGVLQPILVRELERDQYELIAGERRWRAAKRAGLQMIPVIVQTVTEVRSLEQALVENLHREDLNPLEEAAAFHQLIDDFNYTHEQIASRIGKSRTAVTNTLRLLQLPAGVQRSLAEGTISAGHARALLGTPDRAYQEELARRIVAENLTVRAVEDAVRESQRPETTADPSDGGGPELDRDDDAGPVPPEVIDRRRKLPAPGVLELQELLSSHLNTRVKVDLGSKHGRIMIDFATLEDLERIYKLMVQ